MKRIILLSLFMISSYTFAWVEEYSPIIRRNSVELKEVDEEVVSKWLDPNDGFLRYAYSYDLNNDGQMDYIISYSSVGNGVWGNYAIETFVLSSKNGYIVNKFANMGFEAEDIISIKGNNYFLMTGFFYWGTKNGHNYWNYRLFSFSDTGKLEEANDVMSPIFIKYNSTPNHRPDSSLTAQDKLDMWENSKNKFINLK